MSGNANDRPDSKTPKREPAPRPAKPPAADSAQSPPSSGSAAPTKSPVPRPTVRPARPQAPTRPVTDQRLEGVLEEQPVQSIESVIPSGLSTSTYLPSARRDRAFEERLRVRRQYRFRQTVIPSAIVLCLSTLLLAGGWFMLDPTSTLRDNALGKKIPITLGLLSLAFGVISALLMAQAASLARRIESVDKV